MKIKVSTRQFKILLDNFHLIGDKGLKLTMSGRLLKMLSPKLKNINEQKAYKVDIWIGGFRSKLLIYANTGGGARLIARKLFPKATIYNASEFRTRI